MGYSFNLLSNKPITESDYETAINNLSEFNREGSDFIGLVCDVRLDNSKRNITVSGSYSLSEKYAEGFVLNLLMNLLDLGYLPKVLSRDWGYGTEEDWKELESIR